ncbi:MAG: GDSL-type esterase/lipase family protein [Chloroflexota bacterium]
MHLKRWRLGLEIGLVLLLVVSVSINGVLFTAAKKYYYDLQAARFYPLALPAFDRDQRQSPADQPRIVFFGDSRAAEWDFPEIDGVEFVNRGIGGQTSNQIAMRFDEHVLPLEPDVIIVQMCINELKTVPIFLEKRVEILDACKRNTIDLIERAAAEDVIVILTTVFPVGEVSLRRQVFWSDDVAAAVDEINAFLREQSAENVILFDTFELLSLPDGSVNSAYARDELHLNPAGYAILNEELSSLLTNLNLD